MYGILQWTNGKFGVVLHPVLCCHSIFAIFVLDARNSMNVLPGHHMVVRRSFTICFINIHTQRLRTEHTVCTETAWSCPQSFVFGEDFRLLLLFYYIGPSFDSMTFYVSYVMTYEFMIQITHTQHTQKAETQIKRFYSCMSQLRHKDLLVITCINATGSLINNNQ